MPEGLHVAQGANGSGKEQIGVLMMQLQKHSNMFAKGRSKVWVIGMSAGGEVLFTELIHVSDDERPFPGTTPVFWQALQKHCAGLMLARSEVAGIPTPGPEDNFFLHRMAEAGRRKQCPLLDYLIVSELGWYSMLEQQLFLSDPGKEGAD